MIAVCFDMDGVLVDSEEFWVSFQREEMLPEAVPDADVDTDETAGMNFREIYDYLDDEYETAISREAWIERFEDAATEIYGERVTSSMAPTTCSTNSTRAASRPPSSPRRPTTGSGWSWSGSTSRARSTSW